MLLAACDGETEVVVRASWDSAALAELEIMALPFDPDRILDSLGSLAAAPRPSFPNLEVEMLAYERPEDDAFEEVTRPWRALRDTVQQLADSLSAVDRASPGYATQYARFGQLYSRLAQRAAERDAGLQRLGGEHLDLARRATAAAESLRTWEYEAYASYADIAAGDVLRSGRQPVEGITSHEGEARLTLPPGRWWLVARMVDPDNPFMEYYWNVPVTVTGLMPVRLPITDENSQRRWRH